MAIWRRRYADKRTYFDKDSGLIKKQDSELTIRVLGIPMLKRTMNFDADINEKEKGKLGFNN